MAILTPRSKEEFYQSITSDTAFSADFCRKVYGYDISYSGLADKVLALFESFGRPNVRYIYSLYLWAENHFWSEGVKAVNAPEMVRNDIDRNYERQVKEWQKETRQSVEENWMNGMF